MPLTATPSYFIHPQSAVSTIGSKIKVNTIKQSNPVVVIGAGLGGLCCAALLSRAGVPVTVVEQHSVPGGYATSFTRAKGRFCFDVSLHGVSINNNATESILRKAGVLDRIEIVSLPETYRLITPKYDFNIPQRDPESYIRLLSENFPKEAKGIAKVVHYMVDLAKEVNLLHSRGGKFFKPFFPFLYPHMWNVRKKTLANLLDRHIKDGDLKSIISALWVYYGLPPSKMSGFYYGFATGDYLKNGSYYIRDRSQALSDAFAAVIQENGGRIIYNTRATRILLEKNRVSGVVTDRGETLDASAVVSNASPIVTFGKMVPPEALPAKYRQKLDRLRPGLASFIVWLGLNQALHGKIEGSDIYNYTGLGPEAEYAASLAGDIEKMAFAVSIYDNMFEGYSQPGTSTLMLAVLSGYAPWKPFEEDYIKGEKAAYKQMKKEWTDTLIRRAEERVIPGLRDMIEVCVAATPLTNQRYTGNPHGAIYGFEQCLENAFMNRLENRTPIKGLYLAGAWTFPGGGYTAVLWSGEKAYRELMEDAG